MYLNNYQLLPRARIQEFFRDWYGARPSQAFILKSTPAVQGRLNESLTRIRPPLKQAPVTPCDEPGLRVETQLNWGHVVATEQASLYGVHPCRGQKAMRARGILPALQGCAVHDGGASYCQFSNCTHALCIRERRFITEQYKQPWAEEMAHRLLEAKQEIDTGWPQQNCLWPDRRAPYTQRMMKLKQKNVL